MSDVTVIGLGSMGSALAAAFLDKRRSATVWNRTATKAEPLAAKGASVAETPAKAIAASDVTVVCVDNYEVLSQILDTEGCSRCIEGKTLINLSTGIPDDARNAEIRLNSLRAKYLDGAILAYPERIGSEDAAILVSGEEATFRQWESLLRDLAGGTVFVGANVGNASALDSAHLSALFGLHIGLLHGIGICETENLSVPEFGKMLSELMPAFGMEVKHLSDRVASESFDETQAALRTYAAAARRMLVQARASGMNTSFPAFATDMFELGESRGLGGKDLASLIAVFRERGAGQGVGDRT